MSEKDDNTPDRVIDLSARKTEDEWAYAAQGFFETFTPLWFKWIGWTIALGGISFLAEKTSSTSLRVIEAISYLLLSFYFGYFFASFRIGPYHSWTLRQSSKIRRFFAALPLLLVVIGMWLGTRELINHVVEQVTLAK
jgi:succinate dehydrogenase hydrophobic anchor subunit